MDGHHPHRADYLRRELGQKAEYWVGDILEEDKGTRWEIVDVAFRPRENAFLYKAKKRGQGWPDWKEHYQVQNMELVEEGGERPALDDFDRPDDFIDDPEEVDAKLAALDQATHENDT